ncbi:hypothetical protein N483_24320 [Pseudoalteromonas luteoviolacea NCIMB 1944]|nr:hypothetical protein N483_24320 [Pseudoalteromonas luteoviolacea NCIMB 1944]
MANDRKKRKTYDLNIVLTAISIFITLVGIVITVISMM